MTTFVTAFMNIYPKDDPYAGKDIRWRFERFFKLVETGIQICVYVDESGEELLQQCVELFPNTIRIMRVMNIYDTRIHKLCEQYDTIDLPQCRNKPKDTYEYMVLMNSKIEFMYDTIQKNPWNSTHFAWIDFNIAHVFKNIPETQEYLKLIGNSRLTREFLLIPGCWYSLLPDSSDEDIQKSVLDSIHWRFCGGFFIGDSKSIIQFYDLYQEYFPCFLFEYRQLTWEVNFWAWLEWKMARGDTVTNWNPIWFLADHDDSIVRIPYEYVSLCLTKDTKSYQVQVYDYPIIESFRPMSASVTVLSNGYLGLNTRYVNYTLTDTGSYIFHHPDRVIITKNIFSYLDHNMVPISFTEIENPDELTSHDCLFHGIEDIRIWYEGEYLRYIGTSVNYSPSGKNRIIYGKYNIQQQRLVESNVINPPTDTYCEKNWTPVVVTGQTRPATMSPTELVVKEAGSHPCQTSPATMSPTELVVKEAGSPPCQRASVPCSLLTTNSEGGHKERRSPEELGKGQNASSLLSPEQASLAEDYGENTRFVYKWYPMEIGKIDPETNSLQIDTTYSIISPIFKKLRGSTYFREFITDSRYLIGLLHFSEREWPRFYFHQLVLLDKTTLKPVRCTQPFSFQDRNCIEFCIGLFEDKDRYHFWISYFDRDPANISILKTELPFCIEISVS